jgi:hypothetical protein
VFPAGCPARLAQENAGSSEPIGGFVWQIAVLRNLLKSW